MKVTSVAILSDLLVTTTLIEYKIWTKGQEEFILVMKYWDLKLNYMCHFIQQVSLNSANEYPSKEYIKHYKMWYNKEFILLENIQFAVGEITLFVFSKYGN